MSDYIISSYGTGVTWSETPDGGISISGTASGDYYINYYANINQFPANLKAGDTYTIICDGTNVTLNVYFYKNGSYLQGWDVKSATSPKQKTIPADATGAAIRLSIESGVTVNETVHPYILGAKTNAQLSAEVEEIEGTLLSTIAYKGSVSNDTDIGEITETGLYLLTGNTYAPTLYGTLFHLQGSEYVKIQIIYQLADLNIWYRRGTQNGWDSWQSTDTRYYRDYNHIDAEYLAFGDSLMYGALWNGTSENPVITQAPYGTRIPDRIRNAVHCYEYTNHAVGGMAYTFENGSIPKFIDWIKSKDISHADLITIAGGRNDGSSLLGTSNSTSGDGTICGAIREIIEYIRNTNPLCQIVVIQVTPYTSANNPWTSTSSSGWTLNSFDEQVSILCKNLNVGYANWYGCSLFSRWSDFSGGGGNWAHMKDADGYIQMGNFIAGQVSRFYHN